MKLLTRRHPKVIAAIAGLAAVVIAGCGRQPDSVTASPSATAAATSPSISSTPTPDTSVAPQGTATPSPPPGATPRYNAALADGACVFARQEVAAVIGGTVGPPATRHESTTIGCTYSSGTGVAGSPSSPFVSVEFLLAHETQTAFVKRQADSGGTRVQGIGDAAFYIRPIGASSRQLAVHLGSTSFLLELQLPGHDDGALLSALEGFATTGTARIPSP